MKNLFLLIGALLIIGSAHAQESCTEKLYNANQLFENGKIQEAINIARPCANPSNSETDQWQAYHLLAMAYLANDQRQEAKKAAEKMMELNPTYTPGLKEPLELAKLLKSIRVLPKFSLGLAANFGGNITFPVVTANYNGADYNKNYTPKNSWHLGMVMGYNMNEIISLHSGFIASSKKYDIDYSFEDKDITVNENLTYIDVPVFARFSSHPKNNLRAFCDVGIYAGKLVGARSSFAISDSVNNYSNNNLSSENRRNKIEYGYMAGAGLSYSLKDLNISLDLRYYGASFYNLNNEERRYESQNLYYDYYFLDDDVRLNNLALSLSLVKTLNYQILKTKN